MACLSAALATLNPRISTTARFLWRKTTPAGARTDANFIATMASPFTSSLHWTAATGRPRVGLRQWVATPVDMVCDVMFQAVENCFGGALKTGNEVAWLSDNGSCYIAEETSTLSQRIGLRSITTPIRSPQSNGMAQSFVQTIKRDYVSWMPKPDMRTALQNLAIAFNQNNESHPHGALKYRSPRELVLQRIRSSPRPDSWQDRHRSRSSSWREAPDGRRGTLEAAWLVSAICGMER